MFCLIGMEVCYNWYQRNDPARDLLAQCLQITETLKQLMDVQKRMRENMQSILVNLEKFEEEIEALKTEENEVTKDPEELDQGKTLEANTTIWVGDKKFSNTFRFSSSISQKFHYHIRFLFNPDQNFKQGASDAENFLKPISSYRLLPENSVYNRVYKVQGLQNFQKHAMQSVFGHRKHRRLRQIPLWVSRRLKEKEIRMKRLALLYFYISKIAFYLSFSVTFLLFKSPFRVSLLLRVFSWLFIEHQRRRHQRSPNRKGQIQTLEEQIEEVGEISIPTWDARQSLLFEVGAHVHILNLIKSAHKYCNIKTHIWMEGEIPPLVELLEFTNTKMQTDVGTFRTVVFKINENKNKILKHFGSSKGSLQHNAMFLLYDREFRVSDFTMVGTIFQTWPHVILKGRHDYGEGSFDKLLGHYFKCTRCSFLVLNECMFRLVGILNVSTFPSQRHLPLSIKWKTTTLPHGDVEHFTGVFLGILLFQRMISYEETTKAANIYQAFICYTVKILKKISAFQRKYWSVKCQYMDVVLLFKGHEEKIYLREIE
ncbi:hypothetical protein CJ030_MR3G001232 [Morella rubra]|uniref:Uncharacterized protein n=1 Tax=Morella rubra TaxID=262757 RepID=A0A6A1W2F7_9ROSI|nr:hypothetical protein CJ030_MR3G001232 [Morella rubra]